MNSYLSVIAVSCVIPAREESWADSLPPSIKRRDPRIWQMAYAAGSRALAQTDLKPRSIIAGTALGALDETKNFLEMLYAEGFGSPRNFIASVHNSMAGKLALEFKIPGPNITVCDGQNSPASSLVTADLLNDEDFPALLLLIDERIKLLDDLQRGFSDTCKTYLKENWEEAACAMIVCRDNSRARVKIRGIGPVPVDGQKPEIACRKLAGLSGDNPNVKFLFEESCSSFIQPAICVCELIADEAPSHGIIGSYSPTSAAAACVELIHA